MAKSAKAYQMSAKRRQLSARRPIDRSDEARLEEASAEFDREFVADSFGPLTAEAKRRLRRARRKRGRPRIGAGSKAVSVTIEKGLLKQIDRVARRRKTTRARLIARGLRVVLREEEESHCR